MAREIKIEVDGTERAGTVSPNNPITVGSLTNGNSHDIRIKVIDEGVGSDWSNTMSVTPEQSLEPPVITENFYGFWDWDNVDSAGRDEWDGFSNLHKLKSVGSSSVIADLQSRNLKAMSYIGSMHGGMTDAQLRGLIDDASGVLSNNSATFMPYVMLRDEPTSKNMTRAQMEMVVDYAKQLYPTYRFGYTENEYAVRDRADTFPRNADFMGYQTYPYRNPDVSYQNSFSRTESALHGYLDHWLGRIRTEVPNVPEYFIIAQGFAGSDKYTESDGAKNPKWINIPDNSPTWYVNYINTVSDVRGVLWWKYYANTTDITTNYPTATIGSPDTGHADGRFNLTPASLQNMKDAYALLNQE
jgi:hypothetical protein